jgi:hypothetical protein
VKIKSLIGIVGAGTLVAAGTLALGAGQAVAAPPSSGTTALTCSGGDIPSGNYSSITVAGFCDVPDGAVISVVGNINVLAGALLDAQSVPSTITVGHNVTAAAGSLLGLGCQSNTAHAPHPCQFDPEGNSVVMVNGNITTTDADTVLLNGITVNGNVTLTGGGGQIPWAEKNNTIGGNLTISGVTPDWLGVLFSHIGGNATLTNITATDPNDVQAAVSIVVNTIGRNLNCSGLGPRLTGGAFPGEVNTVGGQATGQCANLQSGI